MPVHWLQDTSVSARVLRTAIVLRALAWGSPGQRQTPPIHSGEFRTLTGTPPATFYSHLAVLRTKGWLLSRTAQHGTGRIVVEFPAIEDSGLLESAGWLPSSDSRQPESSSQPENSGGAGTRPIQDEYIRLLGYAPQNWAEGEAKAAKAIGAKYTLAQFRTAYQHYKAQPFWNDKRLTLRYLAGQMPELLANGRAGRRRREDPAEAEALRRSIEQQRQEREQNAARENR